MFESKSLSDVGKVRERNEDCVGHNSEFGFWIVADGVGGNSFGHVASEIAVQSADRAMRQGGSVVEAVASANASVLSASEDNAELSGMASTIVACQFNENCYEISWIGDSRAYYVGKDNQCCLTSDHNMAAETDGADESARHQLTQALGYMSLDQPPVVTGVLDDGDYILLCSDGLSGVVDSQRIYELILRAGSVEEAADLLMSEALAAGAPDNVTLSLVKNAAAALEVPSGLGLDTDEDPSYRCCFDDKEYERNRKSLPYIMAIIALSMLFLILFV